jgi:IS5 family transposase
VGWSDNLTLAESAGCYPVAHRIFSQVEYAGKKKRTRRDKFLAEMEQVVPWARLAKRLQPLYLKGEHSRPPIGLERMLRQRC